MCACCYCCRHRSNGTMLQPAVREADALDDDAHFFKLQGTLRLLPAEVASDRLGPQQHNNSAALELLATSHRFGICFFSDFKGEDLLKSVVEYGMLPTMWTWGLEAASVTFTYPSRELDSLKSYLFTKTWRQDWRVRMCIGTQRL